MSRTPKEATLEKIRLMKGSRHGANLGESKASKQARLEAFWDGLSQLEKKDLWKKLNDKQRNALDAVLRAAPCENPGVTLADLAIEANLSYTVMNNAVSTVLEKAALLGIGEA